jgi:hypothetical protein
MATYQRKPEVIEVVEVLNPTEPDTAEQYFSDMPDWLKTALAKASITWTVDTQTKDVVIELHLPKEIITATAGDYLALQNGVITVMSKDMLEHFYEPMTPD